MEWSKCITVGPMTAVIHGDHPWGLTVMKFSHLVLNPKGFIQFALRRDGTFSGAKITTHTFSNRDVTKVYIN